MKEGAATTHDKMKLVASIISPSVEIDGLPINHQQSFAIELDQLRSEELTKALADSEMVTSITSLLREHPSEMTAIVNDALMGRTEVARQTAVRIGLIEEALPEQRNSVVVWCAIIVVACAIVAMAATQRPQ